MNSNYMYLQATQIVSTFTEKHFKSGSCENTTTLVETSKLITAGCSQYAAAFNSNVQYFYISWLNMRGVANAF